MKKLSLVLFVLCFSAFANAGFGGARGGGGFSGGRASFSSPARSVSSFGGSRATYSAPIVRPSAPTTTTRALPPVQAYGSTTTHVVHHDSGMGFGTGLLVGSALSRSAPVVASGGVIVAEPVNPATGALNFFLNLMILGVAVMAAYFLCRILFGNRSLE